MRDFYDWEKEDMFARLDELRQEGKTNMNFGPSVLREEFDLSRSEAYGFFNDWKLGFAPVKKFLEDENYG